MTSIEERLDNVERILLLKYGTLDYDTIKQSHDENVEAWKETTAYAKKVFDDIDKGSKEHRKVLDESSDKMKESRKKLEEIRKRLGFDA